jgi:hypothetical protein
MGAPVPEMNAVEEATAETLLSSLRTIEPAERRKHASVYNYWLSIRTDRDFPPIRDLDPLEISDAGPFSVLLEMIGGGEDAEIRHFGHAIRGGVAAERLSEAPAPSLLSCIGKRLPVVAATRDAFAFQDEFETADGKTCCWVTLLPFSATGTWIDYVYGFVSLGTGRGAAVAPTEAEPDDVPEFAEPAVVAASEIIEDELPDAAAELSAEVAEVEPPEASETPLDAATAGAAIKPTVSGRFFEALANAGGFYGRPVEIELDLETACLESWEAAEPTAANEPSSPSQPKPTPEGPLHSKLEDVRAKADEARQAKLRANSALYEGLGAAYDFALDAEEAPEEYLKLVETQGIKIQLRSPMKPVAKLAFDGMCDEAAIVQLEAVLDWAFAQELPRGALAERIEDAGGIAAILSGEAKAA